MSKEVLVEALMTKEASLAALRKKILGTLGYKQGLVPRSLGAAGASAAMVPAAELLELSPMTASALMGGAAVAGHDFGGIAAQKLLKQKALPGQVPNTNRFKRFFL